MKLAERLALFESSAVPTWVLDVPHCRFRWVNEPAIALWRAASREELLSREIDMSAATQSRMAGYLAAASAGRSAEEQWTIYPHGKPVSVKLYLSGAPLDDGRTGLLIQGFIQDGQADTDLLRSVESLRHTSVMVTLLDCAGGVLLQNPAALRAFGASPTFCDRFPEPTLAAELLAAAEAGQVFCREGLVLTAQGERWHTIEARRLNDPATGRPAILVHQSDETERRGAERTAEERGQLVAKLERALATVEQQKEEILSLSAPILEVGTGTLALPVIGVLDRQRSAEIEARLLSAIASRRARCVILDLTGAAVTDTTAAEYIARLGRAIRLLGARSLVTGIRPELAQALTSARADMSGLTTLQRLRDGIEAARTSPAAAR